MESELYQGFFLQDGVMAYAVIGSILAVAALGFLGAPLIMWTIGVSAILWGFGAPVAVVAVYFLVSLIFVIPPLRAALVSSWLMKILAGIMPVISDTERSAIEAGSVWVEKDLFSGNPDFKKLINEPYPQLTADEKAFMEGPVERLCAAVDDWKLWETRQLPEAAWDIIKKEKFLGMIIPKEYGGLGFSAMANSEVVHKLSSRSLPMSIMVMVPNSLGPAELLVHYGTEEQKKRYLPKLASGEEIPCFGLTEPTAGSDAASITSNGVLFKGDDGKLYIRLNWNKRWITLAAISTVIGLAFRLRDPDNLMGKGEDLGITAALVPAKTPGVTIGRRHDPLGVPFHNCPTQGKDVIVSVDQVVGSTDGFGRGWQMVTECLAAGRGISLPAQAVGGAKLLMRVVSAHASIRKQFGVPIGQFEGIEEPLARLGGYTYLMEAMRRYTLGAIDKGLKPSVITAIAKYYQTETSRKLINDGMDVMGGAAISRGPKNLIAHLYIGTPIGITVEGANILTRTLIIFGQGALRAHPYAFDEVTTIANKDVKGFDKAFFGHIGHIVRNLFRSVLLSVTRGALASAPVSGATARYYRKLSWASASFAITTDIAMGALGGSLKFKEKLTGRFADILSWMYIGTAVLRRYEAEGRREEDLPFVHFALNHALYEIQKGFSNLFANLEVPGLTWFFSVPLKMWSNMNAFAEEANDRHTHKIATAILNNQELRKRHSEGIYVPSNTDEQFGKLEYVFEVVKRAEATDKKVRKAVKEKQIPKLKGAAAAKAAQEKGIITQDEFNELAKADQLRWEAIQVDDFTEDEYVNRKGFGAEHTKHQAELDKLRTS
jgi:acyl-CoA dehydrogenase